MRTHNPDNEPEVYAVRLTEQARDALQEAREWQAQNIGPAQAALWYDEMLAAAGALATLPLRCPIASEDTSFQEFAPGPHCASFSIIGDGTAHGVCCSPSTPPTPATPPPCASTISAIARSGPSAHGRLKTPPLKQNKTPIAAIGILGLGALALRARKRQAA